MTPEALFNLYFAELKDIDTAYMGFEVTMSLAIITILSWFLTSENAQKIVVYNPIIKKCCLVAICLTSLAELYLVCLVFFHSRNILSIVDKAAQDATMQFPANYYDYRVVDIWTIVVFYTFHIILLTVLAIIITKTKLPQEKDKTVEKT